MAAQANPPVVLVNGKGIFNQNAGNELNLADKNGRVTAVSIIGVQNTGKSTLMNKCLHASFEERHSDNILTRVTKGAMIAVGKSPENADYKILVIDTEGSDGDGGDESFEKKLTLFALSVSNTVIFYMRCGNVGLRGGASVPLMENVFEAMVRIRKFSPPRQINLLFVLRDRNKCPRDKLALKLGEQLQKIWDGLPNAVNARLEDFFKIDVETLPSLVYEENQFDSEVISLREKINSLVEPSGQLYSVSGFIGLAESNWADIMDDKILNISFNRIKISGVLCNQILMEKIEKFSQDQKWIQIQKDVETSEVYEGFGNEVSTIIGSYISEYDEETLSLDENHILEHRGQLTRLLLKEVRPAYNSLVRVARDRTVSNYQKKTAEQIRRDPSAFKKIEHDEFIGEYQTLVKDIFIDQEDRPGVDGDEQVEKLTSELAKTVKAGIYIATERTKLKIQKTELNRQLVGAGVLGSIGVVAAGGAAIAGAIAINGLAAGGASLAVVMEAVAAAGAAGGLTTSAVAGSATTSVVSSATTSAVSAVVSTAGLTSSALSSLYALLPAYHKHCDTKKNLEKTCLEEDPHHAALYGLTQDI